MPFKRPWPAIARCPSAITATTRPSARSCAEVANAMWKRRLSWCIPTAITTWWRTTKSTTASLRTAWTGWAALKVTDEAACRNARIASFDVGELVERAFGMYGGESVLATLLVERQAMDGVIDRFGRGVESVPTGDGKARVYVPVVESPAFFGWVSQFGGRVLIEGPALACGVVPPLFAGHLGRVRVGEGVGAVPGGRARRAVRPRSHPMCGARRADCRAAPGTAPVVRGSPRPSAMRRKDRSRRRRERALAAREVESRPPAPVQGRCSPVQGG